MTEGWKEVQFGDICQKVGENYMPSKNGILRYVGLEHIETGNSILKNCGTETDVRSFKTKFQSGQVLYGKLRPYLDKAVLALFDGVCSTDILVFNAKPNSLNEFLVFLIHTDDFINYAKSTTTGVQHPRTSWQLLKGFKFLLPPLNEQRKIYYILNTLQKAIESHNKLICTSIELKKSLMQKLFTEGISTEKQKETEIGMVPESWEITALANLGEVSYGIQASVANNIKPIGHKILTNKNITLEGTIDLNKINYFQLTSKRHYGSVLKQGDLLFNWRSGSKEHVGKTAIFDLENDDYVHSSFILRIRVNKKHNPRFLFYYLNYLREIGYYQKVQTYSINAKFNKSAINSMAIPMPKKDIQDYIASTLEVVDNNISNLKTIYNLKSILFKTLLNELITGVRQVKDIDFQSLTKEYELIEKPLYMAAEI